MEHEALSEAEPREVFIIACLMVPIIGIGLYPKILTQIYDATTLHLTERLRDSVPTLASGRQVPAQAQADIPMLSLRAPEIRDR